MKARERGPGYQFKFRDANYFEHSLCIGEDGMALLVADLHKVGDYRGGGNQGMVGGRMEGVDPWPEIMAMRKGQFQPPGQMQMQQQRMVQAQIQQGVHQRKQQELQMAQYNENRRGHGQPQAHPHQTPARDPYRPPFRNPFKEALPQGFYGKREYVPDQETILVSQHGQRYDDPSTSWRMMQSLHYLRKQNGG
jgi:hypothetical protein